VVAFTSIAATTEKPLVVPLPCHLAMAIIVKTFLICSYCSHQSMSEFVRVYCGINHFLYFIMLRSLYVSFQVCQLE
jgi:hypothetical protein